MWYFFSLLIFLFYFIIHPHETWAHEHKYAILMMKQNIVPIQRSLTMAILLQSLHKCNLPEATIRRLLFFLTTGAINLRSVKRWKKMLCVLQSDSICWQTFFFFYYKVHFMIFFSLANSSMQIELGFLIFYFFFIFIRIQTSEWRIKPCLGAENCESYFWIFQKREREPDEQQ